MSIREEIVSLQHNMWTIQTYEDKVKFANEILTLLKAEIEKMENHWLEVWDSPRFNAYEQFRKDILKLLEEK